MQAETWANNANAFVAQEDDDNQAYSIRLAGFDLLAVSTISHHYDQQLTLPLGSA
jgi:hypothetical protein